jgi:rhodanese-related sulfurtransferase
MKKFAVLNLVLVLSLLLGSASLAQEPSGDFGVIQRTLEAELADWNLLMSADALYDNLNDGDTSNDPFIVSVRDPADYEKGHIAGAINIPFTEIAKPENLAKLPTDRQIVTYCYTGDAGQLSATVLKALGYDVTNLEYGMMGWTQNDDVLAWPRFGPDTDQRDYAVETEANETTQTYDYPEVATGEEDAWEIVRAAADAWINSGALPFDSADAVFDNLNDGDDSNDPLIVSVRLPDAYAKGHVPGAINIPWTEITKPENLAKLPPDSPIRTYCYNGHAGQLASTALGLLGYDVANMGYGMMAWTEDDEVLGMDRYDPETSPDYPVEGTAVEAPAAEEAAPETVPETGGAAFPVEGILLGFGALTAAAGLYVRRRNTA